MTDPRREHAVFDELAAGYALHSLDPADERQFCDHLAECSRCQQSLTDYADVTAALAETYSAAEPSPQLRHRILAAARNDPARDQSHADVRPEVGTGSARTSADASPAGEKAPPQVASLAQHADKQRRRHSRLVAAAAAAAVIAGGGIWGGLAASGNGGAPAAPLAACVQTHQCQRIQLTSATTHGPVATVIVEAGSAWLMPSGLRPDNTARQVYVLWQITGNHTPLAVGSFDVRARGTTPIQVGGLAIPYGKTWAFAVSLEKGRTIPASPSRPVALGQVSS